MPHTWKIIEISATIKDLRGARLVIPTISSSNKSDLAEQKQDGLHRVSVGYGYFNQVAKPVTATFPDVVSARANKSNPWYEAMGLAVSRSHQ